MPLKVQRWVRRKDKIQDKTTRTNEGIIIMKVKKLGMISTVKTFAIMGIIFGALSAITIIILAMTLTTFVGEFVIPYFFINIFSTTFLAIMIGIFFTLVYNFIGHRITPLEVE